MRKYGTNRIRQFGEPNVNCYRVAVLQVDQRVANRHVVILAARVASATISDFELIEKRMTGRRSCPVCGEIYNMYFKPPKNDNVCDFHSEAHLIHRADDNSETVRARLATYDEQTRPLVDYYRNTGLLRTVDGTREPEDIYRDIENIVKNEAVR